MGAVSEERPLPPAQAYTVMAAVLSEDWFVRNRRVERRDWLTLSVTGTKDGRRTQWHMPRNLYEQIRPRLIAAGTVRVEVGK